MRSGFLTFALDSSLADVQYATLIAVLYATYIPFHIPSNMASVLLFPILI